MNGDVDGEAPRLRPLSGGIWTLFSWLRRSERSFSDESITSVGSDRTVASFDFLAPFHYKNANPVILPQRPLTDTYKKRLQERNLQRQYDRDLTLRRKYGLYTEEGLGYDAFSLPPGRKIPKDHIQNRQRRAISESIVQPRAPYVPGKRRAPLPPTAVISTLPRNYKRKRPAPKPPARITEYNKENIEIKEKIQMTSKSIIEKHSCESNNKISEKYVRNDNSSKEVKLRTEKSFLKQFFDGKKRNSAVDTNYIKVLPSISELDKQAAEIIQNKKLLRNESRSQSQDGTWICTNCLRKYNSTVISCLQCVNRNAIEANNVDTKVSSTASNMCTQTEHTYESNKKNEIDEKKQLKKMLKEMKDSLPKLSKNNEGNSVKSKYTLRTATNEMPTLRIGSSFRDEKSSTPDTLDTENYLKKETHNNYKTQTASDTFLKSQPSSSKQMLPISIFLQSNEKVMKKEELPTNSSSFKDNLKKESQYNVTSPLLKNSFEHKHSKNIEEKLKCISSQLVAENNTLPSVGRQVPKKSLENEHSSINKERKIFTKENPVVQSTKLTDSKITIKDTEKRTSISQKNQFNNDEILIRNILKENKTNIKVTGRSKPMSEIRGKSDNITNKKNENHHSADAAIHIREQTLENNTNASPATSKNTNEPMKISSLLNPIYCPKIYSKENTNASQIDVKKEISIKQKNTFDNRDNIPSSSKMLSTSSPSSDYIKTDLPKREKNIIEESKHQQLANPLTQNIISTPVTSSNNIDHHAKRRDLINQLEQSIAKGDEQTAAKAAAKLAKLKLSCSVLSFSSQIVNGPYQTPSKREQGNVKLLEKNLSQLHENKATVYTETKADISTQGPIGVTNDILVTETTSSDRIIVDKPLASSSSQLPDEIIPIDVWIEDKDATRGPIRLLVTRKAVVGELKKKAEKSLGVQIGLQRWIIGKTLCSNDNIPLITLAGPDLIAPFYLCLVESDTNKDKVTETRNEIDGNNDINDTKGKDTSDVYTELMKLEQQALVSNSEEYECGVCIEQCDIGDGVVLRECIHTFCKECLVDVIRHCAEPVVSCPAIACSGSLQEREIRALLSAEDYEKWLARSLAAVESGTRNTFHCRTRDCTGWAFCEPGVQRFPCPVCNHTNCLPCQAVHDGETCEQYQIKLRAAVTAAETDQTDVGTQALLKSLIDRGEALECPECKAIITKKWGCDWIKCSACKTEICWVTKGRRWGPGGKGDITGGCRCGIDGKRCHPSCAYCH